MKAVRRYDVLAVSADSRRLIHEQRFPIAVTLAVLRKAAACTVCAAVLALSLLTAGLPLTAHAQTACANPDGGYEGFGRSTTGGAGKPVIRVTNLSDYIPGIDSPIPGSLREVLSRIDLDFPTPGNRCVVFDVAGTIELLPSTRPSPCVDDPEGDYISGLILLYGQNITIDGFTAPSPGITLKNWGFDLHGPNRGVGDVIVRGIRIRDTVPGETDTECAGADGFQIVGVQNFVVDHVSIDNWADGSLDITEASSDGTIQWSIIGKGKLRLDMTTSPSMLLDSTRRISVHHNAYVGASDRNPLANWKYDPGVPDDNAVVDIRNNLVWGYTWTGTSVRDRGRANVMHNYYYSEVSNTADGALYIRDDGIAAIAYASGNFSPIGLDIDAMARPGAVKPCGYECSRAIPFYADPVRTTGAVTAAYQIVAQAGAQGPNFGLDVTDQSYINEIALAASPTTYEERAATYQGYWPSYGVETGTFSEVTIVASNQATATATFSFTGTAVSWIGVKCNVCGIATVSIDGGVPATVDTSSPAAPGSLASEPVFSAPGLASGVTHTMVITVTGTTTSAGTHIAVDGFEVTGVVSAATRIEDTDPAVSYTGNWVHLTDPRGTDGTASESATAGAEATLSFTGTGVRWVSFGNRNNGIARVFIDGALVGEVDTYALTEQQQFVVFTATGLTRGVHTLTIEVTGTRNLASTDTWVIIDAFDVTP